MSENYEESKTVEELTSEEQHKYQKIILELKRTLEKDVDGRNSSDLANISKFLEISPYFGEVSSQISYQFARNVLRSAKINRLHKNRQLYEQEDFADKVYMCLLGKIAITRKSKKKYQRKDDDIKALKRIIQLGGSLRQNDGKCQRKNSLRSELDEIHTKAVNHGEIEIIKVMNSNSNLLFNCFDQKMYIQGLCTLQQSFILSINLVSFNKSLKTEYNRQINQKISFFRKLSSFDMFSNQQIKSLIQNIPLEVLKKEDYLYKQGQDFDNMYLLIDGQLRVTKNVQLFRQNPNNLYHRTSSQNSKRKEQKFRYANFQQVYNYTPQQKTIELSNIRPVIVVGEQQIFSNQKREVSVKVASMQAKVFIFNLKNLENICQKRKATAIENFKKKLFENQTDQKISLRKSKLSNNLQLENKMKMNYFFEEDPQESLILNMKSSRKNTRRINSAITTVKARKNSGDEKTKPCFTNFNFDSFLNYKPKVESARKQVFSESVQNIKRLTSQEKKLVQLTHCSDEIKGMIDSTNFLNKRKFKNKNCQISVTQPLFNLQFFHNQTKEKLRIQNKKKNRQLSVSQNSTPRMRTPIKKMNSSHTANLSLLL